MSLRSFTPVVSTLVGLFIIATLTRTSQGQPLRPGSALSVPTASSTVSSCHPPLLEALDRHQKWWHDFFERDVRADVDLVHGEFTEDVYFCLDGECGEGASALLARYSPFRALADEFTITFTNVRCSSSTIFSDWSGLVYKQDKCSAVFGGSLVLVLEQDEARRVRASISAPQQPRFDEVIATCGGAEQVEKQEEHQEL